MSLQAVLLNLQDFDLRTGMMVCPKPNCAQMVKNEGYPAYFAYDSNPNRNQRWI